jgi:YidC/Oxa1 family membrane protein insertase
MFIPGWIPDLSIPESIIDFPDGFRLPILGWTALRALPFIYVGSQLIYGKVTQMPGQQSNTQMKMMLYVMPIAFFFILYNVPSGLLIYWIFSNILTLVQQVIINKYIHAKKAAEPEPPPVTKTVIAPPKKRKK